MHYLRKIREKTRILDVFVGDLEVRLGKNYAVILSFFYALWNGVIVIYSTLSQKFASLDVL